MTFENNPREVVLTVSVADTGKRLDLFLASRLTEFSRSQVRSWIDEGRVAAQFPLKVMKAGLQVFEGQKFQVSIPASKDTDIQAQPLELDIVFEDDQLLVINKPAGLVVHPGAGNPDHTLINALVAHCPGIEGVGGVKRPGLVHRLDKDTSGLLVVAKTDAAYKSLSRQLKSRKFGREYLALTSGTMAGEGLVDAPIGRHITARKKMAVRTEMGKSAVTHFRTLQANEKASFLLLKLETGRTHQIRVHMAYIKHPVLGDEVYGTTVETIARQMLHAFRLAFRHPLTQESLDFWTSPPNDFTACLQGMGFQVPAWKDVAWGNG